jgi:hypothetical protein
VNRRVLALVLAVVAAVGGCGGTGDAAPEPEPPHLGWQEATVPVPPGGAGRLVVRTAAACGDRWYLGGGVAAPDGSTRPAVWTGPDGRTWTPLPVDAISYYGKLNVIYTLACRDGVLAAVGARSGGVHGNPRVSSWRLGADGVLTEVIAAFNLYGGERAVNVARMSAGAAGYMITGNRVSGPAVWTSADATGFQLHEAVQPLANEPGLDAAASDVLATGDGWVVVGGSTATGRVDRDPMAWTSTDGSTWKRTAIAGTGEYEELQRVVAVGDDLLAVGLRGGTYGAWRLPGGHRAAQGSWEALGGFGDTRPPSSGGAQLVAGVLSAAAAGSTVLVTVSDGQRYQLWASRDAGRSWAEATLPAPQAAGADRAAAVAAGPGGRWIYLADDTTAGRVWTADGSG